MKNVNTLYQLQKDLLKQRVNGDITTKQFNACMDSELISTHKETGISKEMIVYRLLQLDPKSNHNKRFDSVNEKNKKGGHYSQIRVGDKIRIEHKKTVGQEFTVTKVNNKTFKCIDKDGWKVNVEKPLAYAI